MKQSILEAYDLWCIAGDRMPTALARYPLLNMHQVAAWTPLRNIYPLQRTFSRFLQLHLDIKENQ